MAAAKEPRGARIEQRITVSAPPAAVWELLADIDGWKTWSGLYADASGIPRAGAPVSLSIVLPGLKPQRAHGTITEATANTRIAYLTRSLGGLVLGHRYMAIEPDGAGSCTVVNGEIMGGLLGPLLAKMVGGKVDEAFRLMNGKLKAQVEKA